MSPEFMSGSLTRHEYTSASPGANFFDRCAISIGTGAPRKVTVPGPRSALFTATGRSPRFCATNVRSTPPLILVTTEVTSRPLGVTAGWANPTGTTAGAAVEDVPGAGGGAGDTTEGSAADEGRLVGVEAEPVSTAPSHPSPNATRTAATSVNDTLGRPPRRCVGLPISQFYSR